MSKKEIELKYFTNKGKYSSFKSETVRNEYKEHPEAKNKSKNDIKSVCNLILSLWFRIIDIPVYR